MSHAIMILALAAALAGCTQARDAATETPVDPTPGLYRITLSGAGLAQYVQDGPGRHRDEVCVRASDSPRFADDLVRNYFPLHPGCTVLAQRSGNAIAGSVTCPVDPSRATGTMTVDYEGTVSADAVQMTSRLNIDTVQPLPGAAASQETDDLPLAKVLVKNAGVRFEAVRTADCA